METLSGVLLASKLRSRQVRDPLLYIHGSLPDTDTTFHGLVRDSVSLTTDSALKVHDLNLNNDSPVPHQNQFIPFNAAWGETSAYGFGGTSLCETDYDASEAAVFYVVVSTDLSAESQH